MSRPGSSSSSRLPPLPIPGPQPARGPRASPDRIFSFLKASFRLSPMSPCVLGITCRRDEGEAQVLEFLLPPSLLSLHLMNSPKVQAGCWPEGAPLALNRHSFR